LSSFNLFKWRRDRSAIILSAIRAIPCVIRGESRIAHARRPPPLRAGEGGAARETGGITAAVAAKQRDIY
jgi:hypothetical protein